MPLHIDRVETEMDVLPVSAPWVGRPGVVPG
jgi:hypothetical protein